jgi:Tol biopolymer transport system component
VLLRPSRAPSVLSLVLAILVSCQTNGPSESEVIAFTSRRNGWFSIYTVAPDGTGLRKLTDIVRAEAAGEGNFLDLLGQPAWSTDGSRIAFTCPFRGQSAICVVDGDGSDAIVLTASLAGPNRYPAWSSDGRIAFTHFVDEAHANIFVANADGTAMRQLTTGHRDAGPTWSPDGSRIAFVRDEGDQHELYVMKADGSDARALTRTAASEGMLAWSPDGQRIAYVVGALDQDIHILDANGSNSRNLTSSPAPEGWPTWSPDGRRLAFMCGPGSGICVMNADGSARRQIVGGPDLNMQPSWRPD